MKKIKIPNIITILILTAVTIIFWIIFSVVRIFSTDPSPSIPEEILNPLNPNYDKSVVDKIEQRIYFDNEQIFEITEQSPTPERTSESSSSGTPESAIESENLN